jgi:hypothetical protein
MWTDGRGGRLDEAILAFPNFAKALENTNMFTSRHLKSVAHCEPVVSLDREVFLE